MIQHPYLLLLLLLFPVYFYFNRRVKFYFRHAYLEGLSGKIAKRYFNWQSFILLGILFLILGAANFVYQMKETIKVQRVHKYVLVNDGSGSMVNYDKDNGIGDELGAVLSGNNELFDFLGKREDGSKDLVGAIVFSDDPYIVSNLSDDPKFVSKKLERIDYRLSPLGSGTNIDVALWTAAEMLMSHNDVVKQSELDRLQLRFYGTVRQIKVDDEIKSIMDRKDKFAGGSIIIFTDGIFFPDGSPFKMSSYRVIDFCRLVGIRVYFISINELGVELSSFCESTGGRGEVVREFDKKKLEGVYNEIVASQANEHIAKEVSVDQSLSTILGAIGFWFIVVGFFIHTTLQLDFTEV